MASNKETALSGNINTNVDQMLEGTELGHLINKYKVPVIAAVILILLGVFGSGFYNSYSDKKNDKLAVKIFDFNETSLKDLTAKKIKAEAFIENYRTLNKEIGSYSGSISLVLGSAKELLNQDKPELALEVLNMASNMKGKYAQYLISLHRASVNEDLKKYPEAITILESLTSSKSKIAEAKIYLDLGRMYLLTGNKEKAKTNFNFVINSLEDKEMRKIAKVYLTKL